MNIRNRLTFSFAFIASFILIVASIFIYLFSSDYRKDDFYQRMENKGRNAAKILLEVAEIDAGMLRRIEKDNPSNLPGEKILIYDYKNTLLYSSDIDSSIKVTISLLNDVRLQQKIRYNVDDYEAIGFLFTDEFDRFAVIVAAKDIYGLKKLSNLLRVLFFVCGIGIILVIIGGWIFSSQAVKPIQRVISDVKHIGINNLHVRVDEGNGMDEIAQLAQSFNNMLARLQEAFVLQKNFIANASHELRTPLTIISGEIEVLLRKDREKAEYASALKSVHDEISTLSKVSNQLLLLAQTSSERKDQSAQEVRCDELIWQVISEMGKLQPNAHIDVRMDSGEEEAFNYAVLGNPHLLKTVFTNLIENACKYSPDKKLVIDIRSDHSYLFLTFSNQQLGLTPSDIKLLYEPFFRGSNSPGLKGNGLGLSLVKNIMDQHQGKMEIELLEDVLIVTIQLEVV